MVQPKKFKNLISSSFSKLFGFENNVVITDDLNVLTRRNTVIKNIIFLFNLFLFLLMLIISVSKIGLEGLDPKVVQNRTIVNWAITVATFPFLFVFNFLLKRMIQPSKSESNQNRDVAIHKQKIAQYFIISYLFIAVSLFYLKVNISPLFFRNGLYFNKSLAFVVLETFSYSLFYVVLTIICLYQDRKAFSYSAGFLFGILTIMHIFVTNRFYAFSFANYKDLINSLVDVLLRSLVFILYSLVLRALTIISETIQHDRIHEKVQRARLQNEFISLTSDLFGVVLNSALTDTSYLEFLTKIANRLGELMGLSTASLNTLVTYCQYLDNHSNFATLLDHEILKSLPQSELTTKVQNGAVIAKRIQLAKKASEIVRTSFESGISKTFIEKQNQIQNTTISQIILTADIYCIMRMSTAYKVAYSHSETIARFKETFRFFIPEDIFTRFIDFHQQFETLYNE